MARTESQKRYVKRRAVTLCAAQVRREEREEMRRLKRLAGKTWLELIYMGLGVRREDVLNSLRLRGSGNSR